MESYGIIEQNSFGQDSLWLEKALEEIKNLGYAKVSSGLSAEKISSVSNAFSEVEEKYGLVFSDDRRQKIKESAMIRAPLLIDESGDFLSIALNENVKQIVAALIRGAFIMTQQNGVVNPAGQSYSQGSWHRDLPYQHFVSSRPLAVNALYCVDDFTLENGATRVLPGSHLHESAPSEDYFQQNAVQVTALAGEILVLDCMIFHSGSPNTSPKKRRGINHVYAIPFFKSQIHVGSHLEKVWGKSLSDQDRSILGISSEEPRSVEEFFKQRELRLS
jgi:ectoine hydroxylase-related dioxygenase (phytanoyl-CoA dioxygenase family)